jgi:hypothetical protein
MTKAHTRRRWRLIGFATSIGAAWWIESLITLEWTYPYCSVLDDGPAGAVRGFPFPYEQASIVASATAFIIPWLYAINLAVIAGGVFLLLRPLLNRLDVSIPRLYKPLVGTAAVLLLGTAVLLEMFALSTGIRHSISSFSESPRYRDLRPVAVRAFGRPRDCTASPFWFPNRGARVNNK